MARQCDSRMWRALVRRIGNRYLLNLLGVLLWPLGWALAALITQGILDFMTDPTFEFIDPSSSLPDLQQTIGVAAVGFWIIFSTIAAPVVIQKVVSSGALGGGELLAGGTSAAIQTASVGRQRGCLRRPVRPTGGGCRRWRGGWFDHALHCQRHRPCRFTGDFARWPGGA